MLLKLPLFIQHTLMYSLGITLMRSVSLFMLPISTYFLSVNEFGLLELLATVAILGSVVVGLGLEDALFRFAGQSKDESEKKSVAANIFSLTVFIGLLVGFLVYPLSFVIVSYIPGEPSVYAVQLVLMILALEGVISVPLGWLRMQDKVMAFFSLTVGRALLHAALSYSFLANGKGVEGMLEAGLLAAMVQAIFLIYLQYKDTGAKFDFLRSKRVVIYSLPIVGSGLLAFGLNGFDRVVIADAISMEQLAFYSVAIKFSIAVTILMQPFGMWWMPKRFSALNSIHGKETVLYYSVMGLAMVILLLLLVGIISPLLIYYMMPTDYIESINYLIGLLIAVSIKEMTEFVNIGCFKNDKTYTQLWINSVVTVIGLFFISYSVFIYQVWGVIASLIIVYSLRLVLFYIYSQKSVKLNYPTGKLLWLFFSSVGLLLTILVDFNNSQFYIKALLVLLFSLLILGVVHQLFYRSGLNAGDYYGFIK